MDNATEDYVPDNCIILSPEELVKLGVKIDNNISSSTCPKNDLKFKNAKNKNPEETVSKNIQDKNNSTSSKGIETHNMETPLQNKVLNSEGKGIQTSFDLHTKLKNKSDNVKACDRKAISNMDKVVEMENKNLKSLSDGKVKKEKTKHNTVHTTVHSKNDSSTNKIVNTVTCFANGQDERDQKETHKKSHLSVMKAGDGDVNTNKLLGGQERSKHLKYLDDNEGIKENTKESEVLLQHATTIPENNNRNLEGNSSILYKSFASENSGALLSDNNLGSGQTKEISIDSSKVLVTDLSSKNDLSSKVHNNINGELKNKHNKSVYKKKEVPKKSLEDDTESSLPNTTELNVSLTNPILPSNSNFEKKVFQHVSAVDDSNSNFEDVQNRCVPETKISGGLNAKKRGRGRPRKSLPPVSNQIFVCEDANINASEQNNDSIISNTSSNSLQNKDSTCGKRKNPQGNKVFRSGFSSDSDSGPTCETSRKRKRGGPNCKPLSSDSECDSSNKDFEPYQKSAKIEASNSHSKSQYDDVVNIQVENIHNKSLTSEETKIPKKRGRPKKNSLEPEKSVVSNFSVNGDNELDDSLIKPSKRGRKRKEVNYLLLENPDLIEEEDKIQTNNSLHDQSAILTSNDIKIEAHGIQYPIDDGTKDDTSESTRYKWTGNVTKAINQMFSTIQQKNIQDPEHNPLLGKSKRRGRPKIDADSLLDKDGTSVCMVCNETIPNPEWVEHKRNVHYNLTWRKGETCLDLSNEVFVQKTFTQLIQVYGEIKCYRCKEKTKSAKKFISHLEMCNGVVNSTGCVTCAICKTTLEKTSWSYHNYRQHNNCAWREGDPPLNLEDQDLVLRILNAIYKAKKPLHCEKCGQQKKSVLGYLSHKTTCQKTQLELEELKVACNLCGKKILPVSMDYHLKTHEREEKEVAVSTDYFNVNVDITGKRKAARQALEVINSITSVALEDSEYYTSQCNFQESFVLDILRKKLTEQSPLKCLFVDCNFSDSLLESIAQHLNACVKKPDQLFVCKLCLAWYLRETDMHDHIKTKHKKLWKGNQDKEFQSVDEQNDSEEDELLEEVEREKKRLRLVGKQKIMNQARVKPLFLIHPIRESLGAIVYPQAYVWMMEFCGTNYNKFNLFQYLRNDQPWQVLDCDILNDYLPKNFQSCDIAAKVITAKENTNTAGELDFRKLDLFEVSELYDGDITIFCGGPVSALAWLPTPYDQKTHNQILAVAVLNKMDKYYSINENNNEPYVVQFWDFGMLDCHQKYDSKPSLLFGMALTCGPIWHLEWCPSGCLDCFEEDPTCRLGLLAVAASDSFVYIYSVDNLSTASDRGLIYKGEPVLKLGLELEVNTLDGQCYYPTKISWSKAAGHEYIAVGYSTGLIALYNLPNGSHLLQRGTNTGINIIFPYKSFQAHFSSITALTLSHLGGGNSLLFSGSFDRSIIFWDLTTMTKITAHKRTGIADGVWMTQWPTSLSVDDESTYNDKAHAHSHYKTIRHLMSPDGTNFTFADSGISGFSYSDWLNTILHGSNAGEVMAQFTHRMFFGIENKLFRSSYIKCLLSVTKLIQKDSSEELAITYDEATEKYKMAFLDYNLDNINNTPNSSTKNGLNFQNLARCDIREYSLQTIKKVVFNPNPQACSYYAIGYQSGFVRLQGIQFVNRLIPK